MFKILIYMIIFISNLSPGCNFKLLRFPECPSTPLIHLVALWRGPQHEVAVLQKRVTKFSGY